MGKNFADKGGKLAIGGLALGVMLSSYQFTLLGEQALIWETSWLEVGEINLTVGWQVDTLTGLMCVLIYGISLLVFVFSLAYMKGDPYLVRYWMYLCLFVGAMLGIVLSNNLLQVFVFWELVGFSSYLLIGFWFEKDAPARASQQAFLVNRVGDIGFLLGIFATWLLFGELNISELGSAKASFDRMSEAWLPACGVLLFLGCIGKSAQFPLQLWLPDAMEGPTPVSSLIHAATMVAAGVYLLARISVIMTTEVLTVVAVVGTLTAFMAAIAATVQWDIKRVLAYSTISQLGYMVMGIGVGAYEMALFHLFTHAFFKCALFLAAGAVIHQLHAAGHEADPQDLRNMGGLRQSMSRTFACYLPPALALAGLPLLSGFLSKDGILLGAVDWAEANGGMLAWLVPMAGFITAGLTAYYVGRHAWLIFGGKLRTPAWAGKISDAPIIMLGPIFILAVFSLWLPWSWNPLDGSSGWFIELIGLSEPAHSDNHWWVGGVSVLLSLGGIAWASLRFRQAAQKFDAPQNGFRQLAFTHFFQKEMYQYAFVKPVLWVKEILAWFDRRIVDGVVNGIAFITVNKHWPYSSLSLVAARFDAVVIDGVVNGIAKSAASMGRRLRHMQSGYLQAYLGIAIFVLLIIMLIFNLFLPNP